MHSRPNTTEKTKSLLTNLPRHALGRNFPLPADPTLPGAAAGRIGRTERLVDDSAVPNAKHVADTPASEPAPTKLPVERPEASTETVDTRTRHEEAEEQGTDTAGIRRSTRLYLDQQAQALKLRAEALDQQAQHLETPQPSSQESTPAAEFTLMDANGDGSVTREEFEAFQQRRQQAPADEPVNQAERVTETPDGATDKKPLDEWSQKLRSAPVSMVRKARAVTGSEDPEELLSYIYEHVGQPDEWWEQLPSAHPR